MLPSRAVRVQLRVQSPVWVGSSWCGGEGVVGDVEGFGLAAGGADFPAEVDLADGGVAGYDAFGLEVAQPVEKVDGAAALVGVEFDDRQSVGAAVDVVGHGYAADGAGAHLLRSAAAAQRGGVDPDHDFTG